MDPLEIVARIGGDSPPTDQELAAARAELQDLLDAATSPDNDSPDIELARDLREGLALVDDEIGERTEASAQVRREADELRAGIFDTDGDEDDDDEVVDADVDDPEPVMAGADVIARLRDRVTATLNEPVDLEPDEPDTFVRGVGPAGGFDLGDEPTLASAAQLFARHAPTVNRGGERLLSIEKRFPEGRRLGSNATENTRKIEAVASPRAVTAAGGICDPLDADHDHPICGERARPIRDALPNFNATRGGLRFAPSMTLGDLSDGITVWTHATDQSPGESTKDCPSLTCDEELEDTVDAVVACLTVGNFQAKFNPEFWASSLDLLMVEHDRVAEQQLLASIDASATDVTGQDLNDGSIVNVLLNLDKATAGIRSRHRLSRSTTFRAILPDWVRDALRAHLIRQNPHGSLDQYSAADSAIASWFPSRNITPVWSPDADVFGVQNAGAINDWPGGDVTIRLFPEGTFVFFDGGTLDLGTEIVDSALNATNDRQAFMETFEKAVFRGCEAYELTVPVEELCICAEGTSV